MESVNAAEEKQFTKRVRYGFGEPLMSTKGFTSYFFFIFSPSIEQCHLPETAPAAGENLDSFKYHISTETHTWQQPPVLAEEKLSHNPLWFSSSQPGISPGFYCLRRQSDAKSDAKMTASSARSWTTVSQHL